jgi:tRNA(fMet)-specific endonuclease VapC
MGRMKRYMLDTNIITHLIKNNSNVVKRVTKATMASLCISAITEGELFFGLSKRPQAKKLHTLLHELLLCVDTQPWDNSVTKTYGALRAELENTGNLLAPLDLLIAAHALSTNVVLVTNDQAFHRVPQLLIEDWTKEC